MKKSDIYLVFLVLSVSAIVHLLFTFNAWMIVGINTFYKIILSDYHPEIISFKYINSGALNIARLQNNSTENVDNKFYYYDLKNDDQP